MLDFCYVYCVQNIHTCAHRGCVCVSFQRFAVSCDVKQKFGTRRDAINCNLANADICQHEQDISEENPLNVNE